MNCHARLDRAPPSCYGKTGSIEFQKASPTDLLFSFTTFPIYRTRRTTSAPHSQARSNASHTAPRAQRTAHLEQAPEFPAQPPKIKFRQPSKAQTRSSQVRAPIARAGKIQYASAPTIIAQPSADSPATLNVKVHSRSHSTFSAYFKYKEFFFKKGSIRAFTKDAKAIFFKKN